MEPIIILKNGDRQKLSEYQKANNLPADKVAEHFSIQEMINPDFGTYFHVSEYLLLVLELFRIRTNEPTIMNSVYRPDEQQASMHSKSNLAAKTSPHPEGMAGDVETKTEEETRRKVAIFEQISKETGIKLRIGFTKYLEKGMTFIHVDVTPMYFAPGKAYHSVKHPWQWELEARW